MPGYPLGTTPRRLLPFGCLWGIKGQPLGMLQGKRRGIPDWYPEHTGHRQRQDHPPGQKADCISASLFECCPAIGAGFLENFLFLAQKFVEQGVFWGVDAGRGALVKCGVVAGGAWSVDRAGLRDEIEVRESIWRGLIDRHTGLF